MSFELIDLVAVILCKEIKCELNQSITFNFDEFLIKWVLSILSHVHKF